KTPDLRGTHVSRAIFPNGPAQSDIRLQARYLKPDGIYHTTGKLTIVGNVPRGARIHVRDGKLVVKGNVADGVMLDVGQPVMSHSERRYFQGPHPKTGVYGVHY